MTDQFRTMCAELVEALHEHTCLYEGHESELVARARALLAQPVAEGPSDEELDVIERQCWIPTEVCNDAGCEYLLDHRRFARAVLARWGHPTPQPVWDDIHYAWELHDAAGDWQAGGSADSLEDVQREGNWYLQTYAQDGPHKLIIQRHCVNTIEEVTHD